MSVAERMAIDGESKSVDLDAAKLEGVLCDGS